MSNKKTNKLIALLISQVSDKYHLCKDCNGKGSSSPPPCECSSCNGLGVREKIIIERTQQQISRALQDYFCKLIHYQYDVNNADAHEEENARKILHQQMQYLEEKFQQWLIGENNYYG